MIKARLVENGTSRESGDKSLLLIVLSGFFLFQGASYAAGDTRAIN